VDLTRALNELAEVLQQQVLPKIRTTFDAAVAEFGFERH
jgi:hypothetical protein